MNANSGNDGSTPAKPKITSKITSEIPSAAANDRITVPISSSGATSDRSSRIRIEKTTTSAIGMITFVSRAAAWRTSYSTADGPPTSMSSPPASFAAARSSGSCRRPRSSTARAPA